MTRDNGRLTELGFGAITTGVARGIVGLSEFGLRGVNYAANWGSVALDTKWSHEHEKEVNQTHETIGATVRYLTKEGGAGEIFDKGVDTLTKAAKGNASALGDMSEFATAFVGGGKASISAGKKISRVASRASKIISKVLKPNKIISSKVLKKRWNSRKWLNGQQRRTRGVRNFYIKQAQSRIFRNKLSIHNTLNKLRHRRAISHEEIVQNLRTKTDFKFTNSFFKSSIDALENGKFLIRHSKEKHIFSRSTSHHELLHMSQFLRDTSLASRSMKMNIVQRQFYEIVPAFIGSPEIFVPLITVSGVPYAIAIWSK